MRVFALAFSLLAAGNAAAAEPDLVELGRRIYQQGQLPDGSPLWGSGAGQAQLTGQQAACVQCHRRSGMGSREGVLPVPPITGPLLYSKPVMYWPVRIGRKAPAIHPTRQDARAAYDDASLARAIRGGLDSLERPLQALMPRYALDDLAMRALIAYLRQLSAAPVPGVEHSEGMQTLHLATIVTPDADASRGKTVTEALSAWSGNGGVSRVKTPLHIWRLEGPPATWGEQLHRHYQRQPVFAVLSGAGGTNWQPVHDFCEQTALPCLFPIVDHGPSEPDDYYSFYFSNGLPFEARLLVKHLQDQPAAGRIVQLVADSLGEDAATQVARSVNADRMEIRHWREVQPADQPADQPASLLAGLRADDLLVAWLRPDQVRTLTEALPAGTQPPVTVLSNQLAPADRLALPESWRAAVRWISARPDPRQVHGKAVIGLVPWAERFKLGLEQEAVLAEVYAATYFFNDALARMRGRWNREYLAETLEIAVDNRPAGAAFYGLSLGPGQRLAAKGGHLLGYAQPDYQRLVTLSPRIVP